MSSEDGQVTLNNFAKEEKTKLEERTIEGAPELPKGWSFKRLGEVCEIKPSKTEISKLADNLEVTFVPMDAVSEITGCIESPSIKRLGEVKKGYTYFKDGDVLFAKITPCMENGKAAVARELINGVGFGSTEFHVIRPSKEIMAEWIFYFVRQKSFRELAARNMTGSVGQQRVPKDFLKNMEIPVPPLDVQRHVVARIEEITSRIEQAKKLREEALKDTEAIMQSALHQTFSKTEEKGWKYIRLRDVAKTTSGGTPSRSVQEYFGGSIPWVKSGELEDNIILKTEESITEEGLKNSSAKLFPEGTLLVAMYGATVGKTGVLGIKATTNQAICAIFPSEKKINKYFIQNFIIWKREELIQNSFGGAQPNINQKVIRNLEIPIPSIEEQNRIVSYLDQLREKVKKLMDYQARTGKEIEAIQQTVLRKAFSGEL